MTQKEAAAAPGQLDASDGGGVPWRLAASVLVAASLGLIALYWETAASMVDLWSRVNAYNHAFLIVPVCFYLVWERRRALGVLQPRPNVFGTLVVAGFGALWLVSDAIDVTVARQAAVVGIAEGLFLALLGWRVFRALLFPLLYLWLIVPIDFGLLPIMQKMATIMSAWGIGATGLPIFVEDVFIEVPSGKYWVAPGCAGLNFLLSGFALSLLYAEQIYRGWRKRVACVVIMIVVAIVSNWFRIFAIIMAGHYLGEVYDINDHYTEGWLFFAGVMFVMMWIGLRFQDPDRGPSVAPTAPEAMARRRGAAAFYLAVAIVSAAAAGFYPAYAAYRRDDAPRPAAARIAFPETVGAWRLTDAPPGWQPSFEGADAQATRRYGNGARALEVFIAYYATQGEGREVVGYANQVYDGEVWQRQRGGAASALIGAAPVGMTVTELRSGASERVVWHVYWVDGRYVANPIVAKLLQAKADLLFGDRRAGVLAVAAGDAGDTVAIEDFLAELPPFPDLIANGR